MDALSLDGTLKGTSLPLLLEFIRVEIRVARTMLSLAREARVERVRVRRVSKAQRACEAAEHALLASYARIEDAERERLAAELAEVCAKLPPA